LDTSALLVEILLAAFFAIACFKARDQETLDFRIAPRALFVLTDRVERLRRSRWQWCSMVLLLVLIRMQRGTPIVAELTVLGQFLVFLMLPSAKAAPKVVRAR